jgi:putative transposase
MPNYRRALVPGGCWFFTLTLPKGERLSAVRQARGERGIWQRRFWEHLIRNDADYARHVPYGLPD